MSKEAALRAMREARYAERQAGSKGAPKVARPAARPTMPEAAGEAVGEVVTEAAPVAAEGLCGHRSMNGRTCTRESGHAAKSHRYG